MIFKIITREPIPRILWVQDAQPNTGIVQFVDQPISFALGRCPLHGIPLGELVRFPMNRIIQRAMA